MQRLLPWAAAGLLLTISLAPLSAADPLATISTYSQMSIDLELLASGSVQVGRGTPLRSALGLATQAAFLSKHPVAFTRDFLVNWDPSIHPEMDIYQSFNFKNGEDPKFDQFKFTRTDRPTKLLMEYTLKIRNHTDDLFLTAPEIESLKASMAALPQKELDNPAFRTAASQFWTNVLQTRFDLYKKGGLSALPINQLGGHDFSVAGEIRSMLKDAPAIRERFKDVLDETCLKTTPGEPAIPAIYYWQMFKADTIATVCLGGIYVAETPESVHILDMQFYVSNSYLTTITLFELFPIQIGGQDCTLIWRTDFVSAPEFASIRGVEQMAAGMIMSQSLKQAVQLFISDANKAGAAIAPATQ